MAMEQARKSTQHVVAIPYPAQGHINPMLQLCRQLVPFGFSFTFINTHHIHQRVQHARQRCPPDYDAQPDYPSNGNKHTHEGQGPHALDAHQNREHLSHPPDAYDDDKYSSIRFLSVAGGLAPEHHAHPSEWSKVFEATHEMQEPVEELISHMVQEQGVAFILSDIMLRWCGITARKFSLPWVCFWPSSAATCAALLYCSELAAEGKCIEITEKEGIGEGGIVEGIPGLPPTHTEDIPTVWDKRTKKVEHVILASFALAAKEGGWLLLNTFEEIEGQAIEALGKRMRTVGLGPLLPAPYMLRAHRDVAQEPSLSLFTEDARCLAWLDAQAPSSVLFISFGSISLRSEEQLQELALGVQASGCPFLWVRRPDILSGFTHDNNSPGVDDAHDTQPRGLIVPWVPQLQVLSHPSIGGFITHCGWNSVMESMSMGVPMLCWADTGERRTNQRFVVEFWKCGVRMVGDSKGVTQHRDDARLVGRDEVEKAVRFLMLDDAGGHVRARAVELKGIATKAFRNSQTHLKDFVLDIEQKRAHTST